MNGSADEQVSGNAQNVLVLVQGEVRRRGLQALLVDAGFSVLTADSFANGAEVLRCRDVDVLVVDLSLGDLDLRSFTETRRKPPQVVVLVGDRDDDRLAAAIYGGARGVVPREDLFPDIIQAIVNVAVGNAFVTKSLLGRTLDALRSFGTQPPNDYVDFLTVREQQVLDLLSEGLSNSEIAARMVVTNSTVKYHVSNILRKLGLKTRVEAVLLTKSTGRRSDRLYRRTVVGSNSATPLD